MSIIRTLSRKILFPAITTLRLEHFISGMKNHKYLILMYHGVSNDNITRINGRHLRESIFKKHLSYFKKYFEVIPLSQLFHRYREKIVPTNNVISITFDDGYLNNYTTAMPLLKKYNFPATFFIQGMSIDNDFPITWPDIIDILKAFKVGILSINDLSFNLNSSTNYYNTKNKIFLYDYIKKLKYFERREVMNTLINNFEIEKKIHKINENNYKLMNESHIKILSENSLFEIGSHGYEHYCLANIEKDYAAHELEKSKSLLEKVCNYQVESIAFPDGSYNSEILNLSTKVGYSNLLAVNYLLPSDLTDTRILPRHGISATTTFESNIIYLHKCFNSIGF